MLIEQIQKLTHLLSVHIRENILDHEKNPSVRLHRQSVHPGRVMNRALDPLLSRAKACIHGPYGHTAGTIEIIPQNPSVIHTFQHGIQAAAHIDHISLRVLLQEEPHRLIVSPLHTGTHEIEDILIIDLPVTSLRMRRHIFHGMFIQENIRKMLGPSRLLPDFLHILMDDGVIRIQQEIMKKLLHVFGLLPVRIQEELPFRSPILKILQGISRILNLLREMPGIGIMAVSGSREDNDVLGNVMQILINRCRKLGPSGIIPDPGLIQQFFHGKELLSHLLCQTGFQLLIEEFRIHDRRDQDHLIRIRQSFLPYLEHQGDGKTRSRPGTHKKQFSCLPVFTMDLIGRDQHVKDFLTIMLRSQRVDGHRNRHSGHTADPLYEAPLLLPDGACVIAVIEIEDISLRSLRDQTVDLEAMNIILLHGKGIGNKSRKLIILLLPAPLYHFL